MSAQTNIIKMNYIKTKIEKNWTFIKRVCVFVRTHTHIYIIASCKLDEERRRLQSNEPMLTSYYF